jgi:hypothetical protein
MNNQKDAKKIEKLADEFIEDNLKDHPINAHDLDTNYEGDDIDHYELVEFLDTKGERQYIEEVKNAILKDKRVKYTELEELEKEGLEDPLVPNEWFYHKDMPLDKVLSYVREEFDFYRRQDEYEESEKEKKMK